MLLPADATDLQILAFVRRWVSLLAERRYSEALALIPAGPHWTPDLLERVIANYGSPEPRRDGRIFQVTPWETAVTAVGEPPPEHDVDWYGERGDVWFTLPLDGEWSDLTATFDLLKSADGLAITLDDVHVH